jgi:type II secretory pathway pseudopilin PulG
MNTHSAQSRRPTVMTGLATGRGYSLLELVFVIGLGVTAAAAAVPQYLAGIDDFRAAGAARYV